MAELLTQEEFLVKASLHQSKALDLSKAVYKNARTKVLLRCNECDFEWEMLPKPLYKKQVKCPECEGRDRISSSYAEQPMTLYFIRIKTEMQDEPEYIYKVGITKYNVANRFNPEDLRKIDILHETKFNKGKDAYALEQEIAEVLKEYKYYGKFKLSSNGNTELYTINPLEFIFGGRG